MSKKRHTKEAQIKAIRDHEAGRSHAEVCKELNNRAQTFYRWKKQLGMMTNPDVRRLKELEKENKELKQMLADGLLRERILKIVVEKTLSPRVLREPPPAPAASPSTASSSTRSPRPGSCSPAESTTTTPIARTAPSATSPRMNSWAAHRAFGLAC